MHLKFQYGNAKGKAFTEEEDRFIVCMTHQLGYGRWEELKYEVSPALVHAQRRCERATGREGECVCGVHAVCKHDGRTSAMAPVRWRFWPTMLNRNAKCSAATMSHSHLLTLFCAQVRRSWNFRFDWFIKSRTPKELENRFKQVLLCSRVRV